MPQKPRKLRPLDPAHITALAELCGESSKVAVALQLQIDRGTLYRALRGEGLLPAMAEYLSDRVCP